MGKIQILSSTNDDYKVGDTIAMMQFLSDYFRSCTDKDDVAPTMTTKLVTPLL